MEQDTVLEYETVLIIIREGDPLCVNRQRLTKNSPVFRQHLDYLQLQELDLTDFSPDVVGIFLTVLEDKNVSHIEDEHFREFHKISVVFKVDWLVRTGRDWLINGVNSMGDEDTKWEEQIFLFEECVHIVSYWPGDDTFLRILVKQVTPEGHPKFITKYVKKKGYKNLQENDLKLILILAGNEVDIVLTMLYRHITSNNEVKGNLCKTTKFILQHIKWPMCYEKNELICDEIFYKLSNRENLSLDDAKLILKLLTATRKEIGRQKRNPNVAVTHSNTREFNSEDDVGYDLESSTARVRINGGENRQIIKRRSMSRTKITELISNSGVRSMFVVVNLMSRMVDLLKIPANSEEFVGSLEKLSQAHRISQRISPQYIDMIIEALKFSERAEKETCINLLKDIKENSSLTSSEENESMIGERLLLDSEKSAPNVISRVIEIFRRRNLQDKTGPNEPSVIKCLYKFSEAAANKLNCKVTGCGCCGFIMKHTQSPHFVEHEICRGWDHLTRTDIHKHDNVCMSDMFWYVVQSAELPDGTRVRIPVRWRKGKSWEWKSWFGVELEWVIEEFRVEYNLMNISNRVAKLF